MKPAPVLVRAFQIEVGGAWPQFRVGVQHRGPTHPGVEPDVQDVGFLTEIGTAAGDTGFPAAAARKPGPRTRSRRPPGAPGL